MLRRSLVIAMTFIAGCLAATPARAQSSDPPRVEFTLSPGGAIAFHEVLPEPRFANYRLGGGLTINLARFIAVEFEAGGEITTFDYNANVVFSARSGSPLVPYVTGGAGALTMSGRDARDINDTEIYFTGNAGGGAKWLTGGGRWGLRGDYRLLAVQAKEDALALFGRATRYGHRVYGGVVVNLK